MRMLSGFVMLNEHLASAGDGSDIGGFELYSILAIGGFSLCLFYML